MFKIGRNMGMKTECTCDACGKDLTTTGNCVDYRLIVGSENIPTVGGFVTAMGKYPPTDRTYYFCGLYCMDVWRDAAREKAKRRKEWIDANSNELGSGMRQLPDLDAMPADLK
jgi:hypothetical protein